MSVKEKFIKANPEPWSISFDSRIQKIVNKGAKKVVVYLYEQADTSTFRYRAYNMCQVLDGSKKWCGSYFFDNELDLLSEYLDMIDVVVVVRVRWSANFDNFISKVKSKKIVTLFDSDDLVFDVEKIPLIMNTLNVSFGVHENYQYWFAYISGIWLTAKKCDATICTNEFLGERMNKSLGTPNYIIPNFLNNEQIEVSQKLFEKRKWSKKKKDIFRIGYFSGTPSHINDFKEVAAEIQDLLYKYPYMILEVVGYMEFPSNFDDLIKYKRVRYTPLVDFLTLQKKISEVDVNIVPLVENEFTNCKSELKFFDAAIVGTITCATPTFTYKNSIRDGVTGFLCESGEWYKTIEKIYNGDYDKGIIDNAQKYCIDKYSPESQLKNIEDVLDSNL